MLLWILLGTAFCVDGFRIENRTRLAYGRDLVLSVSRRAVVMYFTPMRPDYPPVVVWNIQDPAASQWRRGRWDGPYWIVEGVTYEDEGKYTQHDSTNHILSTHVLTITEERVHVSRRVNGTMSIQLRVPLADASLSFTPEGEETETFRLVRLGQLEPGISDSYLGRLQLGLTKIILRDLHEEDSGQYKLYDRQSQLVSTTHLRVSDSDDLAASPYLSLLGLLGVGGCVFCCVRKKCCKKKSPPIQAESHSPDQPNGDSQVFYHPAPNDPCQPTWTDPAGPPPNWTDPAGPPPNWIGPAGPPPNWIGPAGPPPDWNGPQGPPPNWAGPAGPPPNWTGPAGPPPNWAGPPQPNYGPYPPNEPYMYHGPQPQWNADCQNPGYAPVMYSAPPPAAESVKEDQKEPTATDSPAANTEEPAESQKPASPSLPPSSDCLHSSTQGAQFQIDKGDKDSSTHNPLAGAASERVNFL